jgi:2,5-diketo-D-gluconate reductase A
MESLDLGGGVAIPQLGVGVFQVPPDETAENVRAALQLGYRHVDTARVYRNEAETGEGIRASGLDRSEIFITTKCWNSHQGYDEARAACEKSLTLLGVDAVDLYLIHWPAPAQDRYVETWKAFIELQQEGKARAIGVSNFNPAHLARIVDETGVTPAVNQIELHPYLQQAELRREHAARGIVTEAWSPLAQGQVLDDPVINAIAQRHGKTPAQVVIRWQLQLGNVVFPKSMSVQRLRENLDVFGFELSDDDMSAIAGLDRGGRIGPDPETLD